MKRVVQLLSVFSCAFLLVTGNALAVPVGTTAGKLSVDQDGSATYSIPLSLPPGAAGMQPQLSIEYDSQGGNGTLGPGFSVGGLASINRCPATIDQNGYAGAVDFTANDRFCMGSQQLVPLTGGYGAVGTEYRTEIDSFSRIVSYGGNAGDPQWFRVWTKSGLIMDFGSTADSRITGAGRSQALLWAVHRVADTVGNYYVVNYDQNTSSGEFFPASIQYTANDAAGVAANNVVSFSYETRPDVITSYMGGSVVTESALLTQITASANGATARTYQFGYDQAGILDRSRLVSITECGSDGTCLNPTTFGRSSNETPQQWQVPVWGGAAAPAIPISNQCYRGDLNGDGLTDMWCETGSGTGNWAVSLSTGSGWSTTYWSGAAPGFPVSNQCFTGDLNGDGLADMWCETSSASGVWAVSLSTGNGWSTTTWSGAAPALPVTNQCVTGDLNGDGRTDMWCETGNANGIWEASLSTGNAWSSSDWSGPAPGLPVGNQCFTGDLNGDGRTDMWCETGSSTGSWSVAMSTSNAWVTGSWSGPVVVTPVNTQCVTSDFNGDNKTDTVCETGSGSGTWVAYLGTGGNGWAATTWSQGPAPVTPISSQCMVGDINGDGDSDLFCETSSASGVWDVGLFNGSGWTHQRYYGGPSPSLPVYNQCFDGDVNGDGQTDLFCLPSNGSSSWALALSNPLLPGVVTQIVNGYGEQFFIDYSRLTDSSVYTKSSGATYPVMDVRNSRVVVKTMQHSDGIGGLHTVNYQYIGAREELDGRGSLGFAQTNSVDVTTGITEASFFCQSFPYIGWQTYKQKIVGSGILVSEDINTIASAVVLNAGGGNRYFPYYSQTIHRDYEINTGQVFRSEVTQPSYGEPAAAFYGDVTSSVQSIYAGLETSGQVPFVTSTSNSYTNDSNNWLLGRLIQTSVTRSSPEGASGTRTSSYAYDPATGLLTSQTIEPYNSSLTMQTSYSYDGFGNIQFTTLSGPNVASRVTETDYDSHGQFVVAIKNALGHVTQQQHDPLTGNLVSETSPNNATTTWGYDGFGRKQSESRPDGSSTTWSRQWCGGSVSCPGYYALYRTLSQNSDGSYRATVDDVLERHVATQKSGFNGVEIDQLTNYDGRGQVVSASMPYYLNASQVFLTTFGYDPIGRLLIENAPISASQTSGKITQHSYNGLTTTTIDANNGVETQTVNVVGKPIVSVDANSNATYFYYDAFDDLTQTTDPAGNVTAIYYDGRGRKTAQQDPDLGSWFYYYDAFGELISQIDANSNTTTMGYDLLGRMVSRNDALPAGQTIWTYDTEQKGFLYSVSSSGYSRSIITDFIGRPLEDIYDVNGVDYSYSYYYDNIGRLSGTSYPSGIGVNYSYDSFGTLFQVSTGSKVYWTGESADALGHWTAFKYGNNVETYRYYDTATGTVSAIEASGSNNTVQSSSYTWDKLNNLLSRSSTGADGVQDLGYQEAFSYDALNRLTSSSFHTNSGTNVAASALSLSYDAIGNISSKSDEGTYTYSSVHPHAVKSVAPKISTLSIAALVSSYTYDGNGNMISGNGRTVTWTSFNKPSAIVTVGASVTMTYGPDHEVLTQVNQSSAPLLPETVTYVGGLFERHQLGAVTVDKTYIRAGGEIVAIANTNPTIPGTVSNAIVSNLLLQYLHHDHLGSVSAVTGDDGVVLETLGYDPYGQRRTTGPVGVSGSSATAVHTTSWGYTGQENQDSVGLIRVGAREYDPKLGRFMSADPFVQAPNDSQSYNRYSYVVNNPLSETDPSGYFHWRSLGRLFDLANGGLVNSVRETRSLAKHSHVTREIFESAGDIASVFCGPYVGLCVAGNTAFFQNAGGEKGWALVRTSALAGGEAEAGYGIGNEFSTASTSGYAENVVAHGLLSGTTTVLRGGSFGSGFLAGAVSSALAPDYSSNPFVGAAEAAVVGGTTSVIGGGKFGNGAVTGGFGYLFSTTAQDIQNGENFGDAIGKLWALPNTVIGLAVGGVGYGAGLAGYGLGLLDVAPGISIGNNAIQFENFPVGNGALTLGNTILYAGGTDPDDMGNLYGDPRYLNVGFHEMGHTYQYQALGPLFLPAYLLSGGISANNPFERGANNYSAGGSWWPK